MKKRIVSSMLSICILLILLSTCVLAKGNDGTSFAEYTQDRNYLADTLVNGTFYGIAGVPNGDSYDTTVVVSDATGTGETVYSDIAAALNSLGENSGDVLLLINKDITPNKNTVYSLPTDKGITSFTIGTANEMGVTVGGSYKDYSIYANGIPLVIDTGVTLKDNTIYGGGSQSCTGNPSITVNQGATVDDIFGGGYVDGHVTGDVAITIYGTATSIYGGGYESDVTGNVAITIYGTATSIHGGGYVAAVTATENKEATANVAGKVTIRVEGENSVIKGNIYGGGYALSTSENKVEQTLTANVGNGVEIYMDSQHLEGNYIFGGGYSTIYNSRNTDYSGRSVSADVNGGVNILFTGSAQNTKIGTSSSNIHIRGGGYAQVLYGNSESTFSASAQVTGNITIDASANNYATPGYDHWDSSMFYELYGGGYAAGINTQTMVNGDISIKSSRKTQESDHGGLVGGGYAQSGNASVHGNTEVIVCRPAELSADTIYENAKNVIGGGIAGSKGIVNVTGNTKVVIQDNSAFEPTGLLGVIGGGVCLSDSGGQATVGGTTTVEIGDNVNLRERIVGGGYIAASAKTSTVDNVPESTADVLGGVSLTLNGNVAMNSTSYEIIGGGYAYGINSSAQVGSESKNASITVKVLGEITNASYLYGAGYARGANSDASVYGDVKLSFDNAQYTSNVGLGGTAEDNGATLTVHGNTDLVVKDSTIGWFYPAGYRVAVEGDSTIQLLGNATVTGCHVKGDLIVDNGNTGQVKGKFNVIAGDGETKTNAISNSNLYCANTGTYASIQDNATFTGTNTDYALFWNVAQLNIAKDGTLVLGKMQNFVDTSQVSGEGTIVFPASFKSADAMVLWGGFTGTITLKTSAQLDNNTPLAWSQLGTEGTFTYGGDGYTLVRVDTGQWYRWDLVKNLVVNAEVQGEGGSVSPESRSVAPGGTAEFTITREPGYKVKSIMVGHEDKTELLSGTTFTLSDVQEDASIIVTFDAMDANDVKEGAAALPDIPDDQAPTDEQKQTILDTKLDYEALPEAEKAKVPEAEKDKLNDALAKLPNVDVEVQVEVQIEGVEGDVFSVPEDQKPALLENMTKDEAAGLRTGAVEEYRIVVVVAEAQPNEDEVISISNALKGTQAAQNHEVTVEKIIKKNGGDEIGAPVTTLVKPIELVFAIPATVRTPSEGMTRSFAMLRTHQNEDQGYNTETLKGTLDVENWTYTVASDRFSTYTLAYTDTELSMVATPSVLEGGGSVNLQVVGVPGGGSVEVSCDDISIAITKNPDGTFSALLPDSTQTYTFTASYKGDEAHGPGTASCQVSVTKSADPVIYAINVNSPENGTISISPNAGQGSTVTLTVKPDQGYQLDRLAVTDKNGSKLNLIDKGNGKYTFTMPASEVSVEASFEKISGPGLPFIDVNPSDYYYDAVVWAVEKDITTGTSDTTFSPKDPCTRAQVLTFVWRAAGSPTMGQRNPFTDVDSSAYYYDAVLWAVEKGVTIGTSASTFSPDEACTRGQIVTFLHRYAGSPSATSAAPFADVAADAYYAQAVAWAAAEGITVGTGNNNFSPRNDCTRGQIVTFFYRYMGQ